MDSSLALDHYPERRDLLDGFLTEFSLLHRERPELVDVLSFDAYVDFSFRYFALRQHHAHHHGLQRQLTQLRDELDPAGIPSLR